MKNTNVIAIGLSVMALSGCATAASPVLGVLYTEVQGPGMATTAYGGSAKGEACATSILGAYATGDASIEAAKRAGNIAQVVSVDHSSNSILGIYAKYCTIVRGKKGSGGGSKSAPAAAPAAPAAPAAEGDLSL